MSQRAHPVLAPATSVDRPVTSPRLGLQPGKPSVTAQQEAAPALSAGGQPLPGTLRQEFEPFFGHDLSRVRIHTDSPARATAAQLHADAYASGADIAFAANRFLPDTVGGRRLLVHELAHVVQQGMASASPAEARQMPEMLPQRAELEADSAAMAFLAGRPGPTLSSFRPGLARAIKTNGGEFDTQVYSPNSAPGPAAKVVGQTVGADIRLRFTPNELVEADMIGTVQTLRVRRSVKAGGPVDVSSPITKHIGLRALDKTGSDPGRFIDQTDLGEGKKGAPNTSPLYATNAQKGAIPATLTDGAPTPEPAGPRKDYGKAGFGEHGYRKKKADGSFDVKDATLLDHPFETILFAKQQWEMSFEVSALALSGPMANTYLGSVAWGWKSDPAGAVTMAPPALTLVSPGLPSAAFTDAARKWNTGKTVKDPTSKKTLDTVDLPLPTSATETSNKPAAERSTGEMLVALGAVETTLSTATNVDKSAKTLEKRAIEQALAGRQTIVDVNVKKTEDWTGADEVYAQLSSGSKRVKTPVKSLNDGQSGSFALPLPSLMPIKGPIHVQIYDEDTGTFFDRDDLIVNMLWQPPYGGIRNTRSLDEADYDVRVRFNK